MSEKRGDADGGTEEMDESAASDGNPPKLTIVQRILTALPNLDRQRSAAGVTTARASAGSTSGRSATRPTGARRRAAESDTDLGADEFAAGTEEPIEPDEVTESSVRRASSQPRRTSESASAGPTATGARGGRPDATAGMSNEELITAIKRIDERERMYAMVAGVVGAAAGIVQTIIALHTNPAVGHKGHAAPSLIWFEGAARVVFGGAAFGVSFTRRRSLVAFSLLFLGLTVFPVGIIFMGLGLWMLFRVTRYQNALKQRGVAVQRNRTSTPQSRERSGPKGAARSGAVDARQRARDRREARDIRRGRQVVPPGPPASKRYTPKKPTRPKPPAPSE